MGNGRWEGDGEHHVAAICVAVLVAMHDGEEQPVPRVIIQTSFKKPSGPELTDEHKAFNRQLRAIRVRVEHCIGRIQNWKIVATRFQIGSSIP